MKLTLQARYSLVILSSLLSVLLLLTAAVVLQSKSAIRRLSSTSSRIMEEGVLSQLERRAEILIRRLASDLTGPLYKKDIGAIQDAVRSVRGQQDISYVYVYDTAGRILYDGADEKQLSGKILGDAISRNAVSAKTLLFQFADDTLDTAMPITVEGKSIGGVRVGFFLKMIMVDIENMKENLSAISERGLRQTMLATSAIAVILSIVGLIVSISVGRSFSHPITTLSSLTKRVGKGEYDITIPVERTDELGQLSTSFNQLARNLKETTFSRNFLNNILSSMVDPLIVADSRQNIMLVNKATCYLLGYKKEEELIGQPLETVFAQVVKETLEAKRLVKLINQGIMYYETIFQSKRHEEIPVLISGSSVKDEKSNVVWTICTAVDISKRKKAERDMHSAYTQLKETQSQLIQAEKMDAIGRMASGIAHEVKNPLGVILQGVNCLELKLPPAQRETFDILQKIKNNVERADNIIKGLLDFSKLTQLSMQPEEISVIIENALVLVYPRVKMEGVEIVKKFGKDLPKVFVDRRKMEQVFVNVLLNAVQSMPNGGTLTIHSYKTELSERSVAVTKGKNACFLRGQQAVVTEIEDTGKGISKEDLERVYEPFFTTKEPHEGTGLGLSVTMNIIEMHEGCIDIKSKVNKGTKVTVFLKTA